jgi:hypothetical protein
MSDSRSVLRTYVSTEIKARAHALSEQQFLTESVWLRGLVLSALRELTPDKTAPGRAARVARATPRQSGSIAHGKGVPAAHFSMRLRQEDRTLLRERASARGMRSATYVSVLVRAHLRHLAPLPTEELIALKRTVAELGAIGRNLNQLARAANSGDRPTGPARDDLLALLKACEAVRANVKALIKANVNAWDLGHGQPES